MSIRAKFINGLLRSTLKRQLLNIDDVDSFRKMMGGSAGFGPGIPADVKVESLEISGVSCEWISFADSSADRAMVYFHGGGYIVGGFDSHHGIAWRLAKASGLKVLLVDYRLAPENPFPAAVEDATACYRWLLDEGYLPEQLMIGGDSAGGGLAVAVLVNIKNLGLSQPSAAVLMSPWVELTVSGDSMDGNAKADPMLSRAALEFFAKNYLGDLDRKATLASPLFADLSGLPPMLIHVGSTEVLRSDAERLVEKIKQANGNAVLEIWPAMPHVFQLLAGWIPEGKDAVEKLGSFMRNRTTAGQRDNP